jgi:anaerobic ribonucleoside-triphosphate reductase activating protein
MKYSGLIENDITGAPGLCVSFFTQGCPHRCPGCHNPETWDFAGGMDFTPDVLNCIVTALTAQNIQRNLCIMGGEPLCSENIEVTQLVIDTVKEKVPNAKIYIWSGYVYEELVKCEEIKTMLQKCDYLIDGPYQAELRDLTLEMRGSSNQRIIALKD